MGELELRQQERGWDQHGDSDSEEEEREEEIEDPTVGGCAGCISGFCRRRQRKHETSRVLLCLLCSVSALEGADSAMLPSSSKALQDDLGISLTLFGNMILVQALFQACAAPIWGIISDRNILTRKSVLTIGCIGWGCSTVLMSLSWNYYLMVCIRAMNGTMLACLRPISNGLVADVTSEARRGKVYGIVQLSMDLGNMLAGLITTPVSRQVVLDQQGWRVAFFCIGLLSVAMGALVAVFMVEPERQLSKNVPPGGTKRPRGSCCPTLVAECRRVAAYFTMPTFDAIILQGIFGAIPWNALNYLTLFFQSAGIKDAQASMLVSALMVGQAGGHFAGGLIGDAFAARCRYHGRPLTAQISVIAGVPIVWMIFRGIPPGDENNFIWYLLLVVLLGLTATWCAAGVNWPIFSEIVPPDGRSAIIAWDTALEGASGAFFGNLAVTFLAQSVFGYALPSGDAEKPKGPNVSDARALGKALVWTTSVPWLVCMCFYTLLHWSYRRDLLKAEALKDKLWREDTCSSDEGWSDQEDDDVVE